MQRFVFLPLFWGLRTDKFHTSSALLVEVLRPVVERHAIHLPQRVDASQCGPLTLLHKDTLHLQQFKSFSNPYGFALQKKPFTWSGNLIS